MAAFYASASTGLTAYASLKGRPQAEKMWPHLLEWNEKAFGAWAQVHAAAEHAEAFEYGAQVSRLSSALDVFEVVAKGSKAEKVSAEAKVTFNEALAAVKPMQQAACRHNDAVYHERVPPLAALDAVKQHGGRGCPGGAHPSPRLPYGAGTIWLWVALGTLQCRSGPNGRLRRGRQPRPKSRILRPSTTQIEAKCIVKALPVAELAASAASAEGSAAALLAADDSLFSQLVPLNVLQDASVYTARRDDLLRALSEQCDTAAQVAAPQPPARLLA